jgi:CRP/FNR family transcriptional regulator, cyclic AMP receptor protein
VLELTTLGNLNIGQRGSPPLTNFSHRGAALLVYLARCKQPQTRLHLAELFWPERNQEQALANLRTLLTRLRAQLEPYLLVTRDTITLENYRLDANELETALSGQTTPEKLEEAVALYGGKFLDKLDLTASSGFEEWSSQEREHLHRLVENALRQLVSYYTSLQDFSRAIPMLNRLLSFDPLNEEVHRQMLLVLALNGQRQLALEHYGRYNRYLLKELDIAPEAATTDLYENIRAGRFEVGTPATAAPGGGQLPSKISQLQRLALFSGTPLELIAQLAEELAEVNLPAETVVFHKGEPGDCMYIIVEGEVLIHDGDYRLNILKSRDIFGEMALLDSAPRLATATAFTPVRLWRLDQVTLYRLMEKRVEVARAIIKVLLGWLRERVSEVVWLNSRLERPD